MAIDSDTIQNLVEFHKALADETRLKLIGLLALRPMCGLDLARELGVSAPTISHHISKLKGLDLVRFVREDNTVYYALDTERLHALSKLTFGRDADAPGAVKRPADERQKVLSSFFAPDGRLKSMPTQMKRQLYVLEELARDFESDREYPEREVNEVIKRRYDDFCTIRRDFIIHRYMTRVGGGGAYRLTPPDTWPKPEQM